MRIDLHTHSRASDGTQSPTELVHAAVAADLDVLALTDHDTADGWDEAAGAASDAGLRLVRGMEISTRFEGQGVHLLAYLPDPSYPPLAAELERILEGRRSRVPGILEGLRGAGISLTEADVARVSGHSVASGRPHVADALVALGVVADRTEAFDRLLSPGRPGYVDRYAAPLRDMIGLVTAAGGVCVVAHVWGRRHDESPDARALAELAGLGLAGIEVDHQDHPPDARERLRTIARELDLVVTGSSDHHGDGKVDHDLGCHTTAPDQLERLLDLAAAAALASGRDAPGLV